MAIGENVFQFDRNIIGIHSFNVILLLMDISFTLKTNETKVYHIKMQVQIVSDL